jgi:hypothetical protein
MKKSGRSHKYKRVVFTETRLWDKPIYSKKVTEIISPIPQEVNEEGKISVGCTVNQFGNVGGSITKENKRKTKLPKNSSH